MAMLVLPFCFPLKENGKRDETRSLNINPPKNNQTKLVVAYPTGAAFYVQDQKMVEDAVNQIVKEKLDMEIDFKVMLSNYEEEISSMMAGQQQLDVLFCTNDMQAEMRMNHELYQLDELLEKYGQGIVKEIGKQGIDTSRIQGELYGLPNNRDYATGWNGYILRKDILDKYHIKKEEITDMEALEKVFAVVKAGEPQMEILDCDGYTLLDNQYYVSGSGYMPFGVHMDYGREEELKNLFHTEEYREALKRLYRWKQCGYIHKEITDFPISIDYKMYTGSLFAYGCKGKPGIEQQEKMSHGKEVVFVQLGENSLSGNSGAALTWGISSNTISPEKSMQLLNLFYTDSDIMNLFSYGVEGVHYVKKADGHITFPAGKNINPFIGESWKMPNQFITYVWEGNPLDLWEDMRRFNEESFHDCEYGFNFDITPVYTEYMELENIYMRYRIILENAMVDPEEGLDQLNRELDANFIDEVIKEKQRQYEEWKSKKTS